MGKHWNQNFEDRLFPSWTDNIQEFISNLATNFYLTKNSATSVKVAAAAGAGQVSIGLGGPWRFNVEDFALTISGAASTQTIWAVAVSANDFEGAGDDPDATTYTFELRATTGAEPGGVFYARKIGTVVWTGTAIQSIQQTLNKTTGAMIEAAALSNLGDILWVQDTTGAWIATIRTSKVTRAKLQSTVEAKSGSVVALAAGAETSLTITWDTGFADALYLVNTELVGGVTLSEVRCWVKEVFADHIVVRLRNESEAPKTFSVHAIAVMHA